VHILVTGNMGYIGPVVASVFRESEPDLRLTGLDTGFFAGCLVDLTDFPETLYDEQIFMDVRELEGARLAGVDAVVQLAAISNDPMGKEFESVTEEINARAALDVARKAKAAGVRHFVFASSCSVYGLGHDGSRTEASEVNPLTAYARSKIQAERLLRGLADNSFTVTCLRFGTACGWSPRLRLDLVLNDFVASAVTTARIDILSDGSPWRPMIHVRDMARAIYWASTRQTNGADDAFVVVNVGRDDWNFQVKDLAHAVQKVLPAIEVRINPDATPDKRSYRVDFARFRELAPQHQPRENLNQSIAELVDRLRAHHFEDTTFRTSNLIRLKVLAGLRDRGVLSDSLRFTNRNVTPSRER
jgi:nucleoside-diphosphate-sugar epimerase